MASRLFAAGLFLFVLSWPTAQAVAPPTDDRMHGIDIFVRMDRVGAPAPAATKAGREGEEPRSLSTLIGLAMTEARIVPRTFDELTIEDAREILGPMPPNRTPLA